MKWKISFLITIVLLVVSNVYWVYMILDAGVSLTYQEDSYIECKNNLSITKNMLMNIIGGMELDDFMLQANRLKENGSEVFNKENIVSVDDVNFIFHDRKLAEIR